MCPACLPACVHDVPRTSRCACVRASRALPMTLCNCSPDSLSCLPMNHCSLPCVRSQSCTRSNYLDHFSCARANLPQNRSGCSRLSLYHVTWSSLTCLISILRQTTRMSSAHSNSYSYALTQTNARTATRRQSAVALSLSCEMFHSKSAHSHSKLNISILHFRTAVHKAARCKFVRSNN